MARVVEPMVLAVALAVCLMAAATVRLLGKGTAPAAPEKGQQSITELPSARKAARRHEGEQAR
jgi:hypothetical protein